MKKNDDELFYGIAFVAVFLICWAITLISGRREAWDSPVYFLVGIPVMCMVILGLAYKNSDRAWRGLATAAPRVVPLKSRFLRLFSNS